VSLDEFIEHATKIDGEVSSALLLSVFEFDTPLHDGAVIIRDGRIAAAPAVSFRYRSSRT
jgi:diadenylate cyclase